MAREAARVPIGVVLVIASRLERLGWSIVLERQPDMRLLAQFAHCREALASLDAGPPHVMLIDEDLLTPRYCEALEQYARCVETRFLLVTSHPLEQWLASSCYSFASECLLKGLAAEELLRAIRRQVPSCVHLAQKGGEKV